MPNCDQVENLEKLLQRSKTTRQNDEPIGQLSHQRLAFMHRVNDPQIRQARVGHFIGQGLRDDANDLPARFEGAVSQFTHHANSRAAIDQRQVPSRENTAQIFGDLNILGICDPKFEPLDSRHNEPRTGYVYCVGLRTRYILRYNTFGQCKIEGTALADCALYANLAAQSLDDPAHNR